LPTFFAGPDENPEGGGASWSFWDAELLKKGWLVVS
jgi:hypothetical protein